MQPLDVGCFQPLKWYYGRVLDYQARTGAIDIKKVDFFATLESIRREAFTQGTIQSGWLKTGLHPWAPEVVLQRIRIYEAVDEPTSRPATPKARQPITPTFESSDLDEDPSTEVVLSPQPLNRFTMVRGNIHWARIRARHPPTTPPRQLLPGPGDKGWKTPLTIRTLDRQTSRLIGSTKTLLPASIARDFERHLRGSNAIARVSEGFKRELLLTQAATHAREERRARKRRKLQDVGGPLYADEAREMRVTRIENEITTAERALKAKKLREITTIANRYKRILPTTRTAGKRRVKRAQDEITMFTARNTLQYLANDESFILKATTTQIATQISFLAAEIYAVDGQGKMFNSDDEGSGDDSEVESADELYE
jgi:hypothetical protein